MKTSFKLFIGVVALICITESCYRGEFFGVRGKGAVVKETRNVTGFTKVRAGASFDVQITQAPEFKVELEGQKNILAILTTEVVNGELKLSFSKNVSRYKTLKIIFRRLLLRVCTYRAAGIWNRRTRCRVKN